MAATNCKPGQMALVVRGFPECNLGRIVRVTALNDGISVLTGTAMWDFEGDLVGPLGGPAGAVADACLKPLRDPGDNEVDEMVRGVSCFVTRTGEVTHG